MRGTTRTPKPLPLPEQEREPLHVKSPLNLFICLFSSNETIYDTTPFQLRHLCTLQKDLLHYDPDAGLPTHPRFLPHPFRKVILLRTHTSGSGLQGRECPSRGHRPQPSWVTSSPHSPSPSTRACPTVPDIVTPGSHGGTPRT